MPAKASAPKCVRQSVIIIPVGAIPYGCPCMEILNALKEHLYWQKTKPNITITPVDTGLRNLSQST